MSAEGVPVAWAVARNDGTLNGTPHDNERDASARVARLNAETGEYAEFVVKNQPYRVVPLYTHPAAASAESIRAEVIEECAKVCEAEAVKWKKPRYRYAEASATHCASSIRALLARGGE